MIDFNEVSIRNYIDNYLKGITLKTIKSKGVSPILVMCLSKDGALRPLEGNTYLYGSREVRKVQKLIEGLPKNEEVKGYIFSVQVSNVHDENGDNLGDAILLGYSFLDEEQQVFNGLRISYVDISEVMKDKTSQNEYLQKTKNTYFSEFINAEDLDHDTAMLEFEEKFWPVLKPNYLVMVLDSSWDEPLFIDEFFKSPYKE